MLANAQVKRKINRGRETFRFFLAAIPVIGFVIFGLVPMVVSLMGACVFRLIWIWGLFAVNPNAPITDVYISYPISWALTAAVHAVCFVVLLKKVKKKYPEAEIKG